ncbi:MAG: M20 family metallopeptidase [Actinobacteria bacterium]|nr:M20 family metallopeptidase [Actinomycetota bacterium]
MSVSAERVRDLAFELVGVRSPTGDTARVARLYARRLTEIGMDVMVLDDHFPATPTVIGRLRGGERGPTVVLNGHLDTVEIPHAAPHIDGDVVCGRGSADMKGALASAAEAVRVLGEQGGFKGEVAIVATGLHEAPDGRGEDLTHLLGEQGFTADYAIVCELAAHEAIVAHLGSATFEITISRPGMPMHELEAPRGTPHPLLAAGQVINAIARRTAELAETEHPFVGAETFFIGEVHGGDFYNRHPTTCRLVGTRRWAPTNSLAAVETELRELLAEIAKVTLCEIALDLRLVRGAYEIDPSHPLLLALQDSYREVTGRELAQGGLKTVADGAIFAAAGIPSVYHGPKGCGAHADEEQMPVAELVRAAEVYVTLLNRLLS